MDSAEARAQLAKWAQHKDEKIRGLKSGNWSMWDDIKDLPQDAINYIPARQAGDALAGLSESGSDNPYFGAVDTYNKAKDVAEKQNLGESMNPADNRVISAWKSLKLSGY